jgi:hypothetical protein
MQRDWLSALELAWYPTQLEGKSLIAGAEV